MTNDIVSGQLTDLKLVRSVDFSPQPSEWTKRRLGYF